MTDITDPGSISNGDTPDWDVVQTYFDAIYAVINNPGQIDNNNIKSAAGIAYSKLNLTGSVATADLASGAATAAKISLGAASSDGSSAVTNIPASTWTSTTTTLTAASTGLYLITCEGHITDNSASSATPTIGSRLLVGITALQQILYQLPITTAGNIWPFQHVKLASLTASDVVSHQVYSTTGVSDVASSGFTLQMVRLSS